MAMAGKGLTCRKCGRPLSVFYARDFKKMYGLAPGLKSRDWVVIRAKCMKHGKTKLKLNAFNKEAWFDDFTSAVLRCMKCENLGTIENVQERGAWIYFQINCPEHGLTEKKAVVTSLFYLITDLQKQRTTYVDYMETQAPSTFSLCPKCGHMVEPGSKFCDKCGADLMST
jgi:hypothetical protein